MHAHAHLSWLIEVKQSLNVDESALVQLHWHEKINAEMRAFVFYLICDHSSTLHNCLTSRKQSSWAGVCVCDPHALIQILD